MRKNILTTIVLSSLVALPLACEARTLASGTSGVINTPSAYVRSMGHAAATYQYTEDYSVIGGDGFGYITEQGKHSKVLQVGNVVIGDDVEIGNNTCIDRATAGSTIVGAGTKIDNLVHLGHNDVLGENCLVVAQVGLSGSITAGHNVTFAGQVGSVGHVKIGDNCVFAARCGITSDVPSNSFYAGFPAVPHREWLKQEATLRNVSKLVKKVKELEKALTEIQGKE